MASEGDMGLKETEAEERGLHHVLR